MNGLAQLWSQGDAVTRGVALVLLLMSVVAWVLMLWKAWTLARARRGLARAVPAFWSAGDLEVGRQQLAALDEEAVAVPLLEAALRPVPAGTLEAGGPREAVLTRQLRDALHRVLARLQAGQVVLASIGSTAPFIGLLGTVWGIYHALLRIGASGSLAIDQVAGPVGEALVMTAAGLAVAIPAVLGYNLFGQWVAACEAELEGFAHDLRDLLATPAEAG